MKHYINPFVERKRKNIELTFKIIKEAKKMPQKKIMGTIQSWGYSKETAKDYLKILVDTESIVIENDYVKIKSEK